MWRTLFAIFIVTTGCHFKVINNSKFNDENQQNELDSDRSKTSLGDGNALESSKNQSDQHFAEFPLRAVFKKTPKSTVCTSGNHVTPKINQKGTKHHLAGSSEELVNVDDSRSQIGMFWKFGVVPYYVNSTHYDVTLMARIKEVMNTIESASCLRFKLLDKLPVSQTNDYIYFYNPTKKRECPHFDLSGHRKSGQIILSIGYNCLSKPQILHSLLHGLGLVDEVKHPSRDQYVQISWDNVQARYLNLFRKVADDSYLGKAKYDPTSVMHFHDRGFTKNGKPTIRALKPGFIINPSDTLTHEDRQKLQFIIGGECERKKVNSIKDTCLSDMKNDTSTTDPQQLDDSDSDSDKGRKGRNLNPLKYHKKRKKRVTVFVTQEDWW